MTFALIVNLPVRSATSGKLAVRVSPGGISPMLSSAGFPFADADIPVGTSTHAMALSIAVEPVFVADTFTVTRSPAAVNAGASTWIFIVAVSASPVADFVAFKPSSVSAVAESATVPFLIGRSTSEIFRALPPGTLSKYHDTAVPLRRIGTGSDDTNSVPSGITVRTVADELSVRPPFANDSTIGTSRFSASVRGILTSMLICAVAGRPRFSMAVGP